MADYELSQIEDFFNEQRAKARWPYKRLDATDWHFMAAWQKDGVPFVCICRGIEEVFTNHLRRQAQGRINTVRYCEAAIKRHHKDHVAAHVGGHDAPNGHQSDFGIGRILEATQDWIEQLDSLAEQYAEDAPFAECFTQASASIAQLRAGLTEQPDYEALDATLGTLETLIMTAVLGHITTDHFDTLYKEAFKNLAKYKDTMMDGLWRETMQKAIEKKLREEYHIPRLSLFYL